MDYKKELIKMIEEIENEEYLKKIYYYVSVPYRKEKGESKVNQTKSEKLMQKISNIIEVLPESERQRTYDYLSELYFS